MQIEDLENRISDSTDLSPLTAKFAHNLFNIMTDICVGAPISEKKVLSESKILQCAADGATFNL